MIFISRTTGSEIVSFVSSTIEASPIPDEKHIYGMLNNFLRQIYSDLIEDVRVITKTIDASGEISFDGISIDGCQSPRTSDVVKIVVRGYEYERVGEDWREEHVAEGVHFYRARENCVSLLGESFEGEKAEIYLRVLPQDYSSKNENEPLCLPEEFVGLVYARLRSDIYRMLGEEALCTSATEEYNGILAHFAAWLEERR